MPYKFDSELAAAAAMFPAMSFDNLTAARAWLDAAVADKNAAVDISRLSVQDRLIPGLDNAPAVKVRVYAPRRQAASTAALLYIHGGGFMVGNLDSEHASAALLADKLGIVVVSVEYRLAPEHPYPAGLEDCFAALCWLQASVGELSVDIARIGVIGQSAGGGLAAGVALLTRDRRGPSLCFQYLGMPELDDRLETASMRAFVDTPLWNRPSAVVSWSSYLGTGHRPGAADVPCYAAPARATDLRGLPPAYIAVMEFDPLRDEGILYGLKLLEAGVPVELHTFPGTFHGSSMVEHAAVTQRQQWEMLGVLARALQLKIA